MQSLKGQHKDSGFILKYSIFPMILKGLKQEVDISDWYFGYSVYSREVKPE